MRRFSNTAIRDQVARISSEGCAKIAKFLAPPLGDLLRMGNSPRVLPLVMPDGCTISEESTNRGGR